MTIDQIDNLTNALAQSDAANAAIRANIGAPLPMDDDHIAQLLDWQFECLKEARKIAHQIAMEGSKQEAA